MEANLTARVQERIRIELARRDMTQTALARMLGWSDMSLSRRMRGLIPITTDHLQQIADAFEIPVDELIGREVRI